MSAEVKKMLLQLTFNLEASSRKTLSSLKLNFKKFGDFIFEDRKVYSKIKNVSTWKVSLPKKIFRLKKIFTLMSKEFQLMKKKNFFLSALRTWIRWKNNFIFNYVYIKSLLEKIFTLFKVHLDSDVILYKKSVSSLLMW